MAYRSECFQRHVAARDGPLTISLQHQCSDEADHSGVIQEYADNVGSSLDLLVHPFQRICGRDLGSVVFRECHVGQHVLTRCAHHVGQLRELLGQGIRQGVHPLANLGNQTADQALRNTAGAHRLYQTINRAGRDMMEVVLAVS